MNSSRDFRDLGRCGVNFRPRAGLFVHALVALLLVPEAAWADRVVLHQPVPTPGGGAEVELLDHVEDALATALRDLGHDVLFEHGVADVPPPVDSNEMRAIVEFHGSEYLVVPHVRPLDVGYAVDFQVFWAPRSRLERMEVEVHRDRESERLREVLFSMVNDRGVEGARDALEGPDRVARALAAEAAQKREEEAVHVDEPEPAVEAQDAPAVEAQGAPAAPAAPAAAAPAQAPLAPNMVQAGVAVRPIVLHDDRASGGVIGAITLRGGRRIAALPSLEIRGALEVGFGAAGSASLLVGGAYLAPFGAKQRFRVGGSLEAGLHGATTGDKGAAFAGRVALVADVQVAGPFRLEVGLPELQYVSTGKGALTLGGYVGGTARF